MISVASAEDCKKEEGLTEGITGGFKDNCFNLCKQRFKNESALVGYLKKFYIKQHLTAYRSAAPTIRMLVLEQEKNDFFDSGREGLMG